MNLMNFAVGYALAERYDHIDSDDRGRAAIVAALMPEPFVGIVTAKTMLDRAEDNASVAPGVEGTATVSDKNVGWLIAEGEQDAHIEDARQDASSALKVANAANQSAQDALMLLGTLRTDIDGLTKAVATLQASLQVTKTPTK
ncbi:hypothetical protein [Sphingomonas sp. CARO-RG-8B-R24-01]|uniref:hypothetical protein n=1 Tax=Sphingomonas sp. CARO-RG-8B-R24-01 TaxID=2914831 RepID=UPI001F5A61C5|nr:hypothetical protein [Sphingomonas sp. CARO-RG-8B-R24-01]